VAWRLLCWLRLGLLARRRLLVAACGARGWLSAMMADVQSSTLVRDLRAESRSLGQAWLALQDEVEQLERHRSLLRHEWKDLEEERDKLGKERERFERLVQQEWFPANIETVNADRVVRLNVGGQVFEITAKLLLRERFSLLAATCLPDEESILRPDAQGCFFFDRDWFLFRHVLAFLQSGTLPKETPRLRELHQEAGFYCLGAMQRAIETVLADMANAKPDAVDQVTGSMYAAALSSGDAVKYAAARASERRRKDSLVAPPLPDPFGFTKKSTKL
jgi:hypothetical protein